LLDGRSITCAGVGAGVCAETNAAKRQIEAADKNAAILADMKTGPQIHRPIEQRADESKIKNGRGHMRPKPISIV
jgi:hypothetical protein